VVDGECFHDFCDEPAERCQIDHVTPSCEGGETTEDNGRVACAFHNRWLELQRRKRRRQDE
ncbi:MAG TPA: HNH endonuclease, partial [Acidimicrobiales bacterium]|nr:HNH endonuclease [Acidimicrobiales bacterium]